MAWTYNSTTGRMDRDDKIIATCYSGHGKGLNNPDMETVVGIGPIPRGNYTIGPWEEFHTHLGPCVAPLIPDKDTAHGRSGFFIHGDNANMDHTASDGCVIAGRPLREAMRASGETKLTVV